MKFIMSIFKTFFVSLCIIANTAFAYAQTASILPPAKTTFVDQNGKPLTSGTVDFYVPGTSTRKTTWQDSSKAVPNTNPVTLDAAGRALILGDGAYRQVVKDRNGNLQWDQVTSSLGSSGSSGSTIGDGLPVGTILPSSGIIAPANYQFAYGQALSRASYPELFAAVTIQTSIGCIGGSPLINVTDTTNISVGTVLESICAAGSPTVIAKTINTVTLSSNSTITVTTNGRFFLYGNGDALTTFNVADMRGYVPAGRCNMGGVNCSVLNSTYFSSNSNNTPSGLNAKGGNQNVALAASNLPTHTHASPTVTDPGHNHNFGNNPTYTGLANNSVSGPGAISAAVTSAILQTIASSTTGISLSAQTGINTTTNTPVSLLQPTLTLNYAIKVTPDTNLTSTYGVAALGGMTGIITCGSNVICSGNSISFNWSGVNSIQGMSGDITCGSGLTCSSGSISANSVNPQVITSRTVAQSLDLSIYSSIQTLGYATGGDGGGAVFKKTTAPAFFDSFVTGINITNNGSGCTDGTYYGVYYGGGSGQGVIGVVTVAGGVVTGATITTPGNQYVVGDTLNKNGFFTCTTTDPVFTVSSTSTPSGSFTDLAGNKWQIIPQLSNTVNVFQFGAKCDWARATGDAAATDDTTAIQNALNYAYGSAGKAEQGYVGAGGVGGMKVTLPPGYCMTSSLTIPCYVSVYGPGPWSGGFKVRDNLAAANHYITVGDSNTHQACFAAGLYDLIIFPGSGAANVNTYMIYSNNIQQHTFLGRVTISAGQRGAIYIENGYGGAAMVGMEQIEAGSSQTATPIIRLAYSTAITTLRNVIVENGGTFCHAPVVCKGILVEYGYVNVDSYHSEGISYPIYITNPFAQGISTYRNLTCGLGTAACVTRDAAATAGLAKIGAAYGQTATLDDGGAFTVGNIVADVVF